VKVDKIEDKDRAESREDEAAVVDGQLSLLGDEEAEGAAEAENSEKLEQEDAAVSEDAAADTEESSETEETKDSEGTEGAKKGTGEDGGPDAEEAEKPEKSAKAKKAGGKKPVRLAKPGGKKKPSAPRGERRDAPLWSVIAMAVVVVGLAVGTFVLRAGSGEALTKEEIDKAVRTAAATAQHISSWDYRTIESDTKQVLSETTGDFREAYEKSAAKLLESAPAQEAVTVGLTSKAGVESVANGRVKVLVFLNQQTTRKNADAHIEQHRLLLTMVQKDGEWLVSKLDILG
jgi:Mce-associated membrane protein